MTGYHKDIFKQLLNEVEKGLNKTSSAEWTHHDFQEIRQIIFDKTGSYLGVNTLKRMWGKVSGFSVPNHSTLEILASYAGYDSWEQYFNKHIHLAGNAPEKKQRPFRLWIFLLVVVATSILAAVLFVQPKKNIEKEIKADDIIHNVSDTIGPAPLPLIFTYDLSGYEEDTIILQVKNNKHILSQKESFQSVQRDKHTFKFYFDKPGIQKVSLIANNKSIRDYHVLVTSNKWQGGIAEEGKAPKETIEPLIENGSITLPENTTIPEKPNRILFHYFDSLGVDGNNMEFEIRFKYNKAEISKECKPVVLSLSDIASNSIYIVAGNSKCQIQSAISIAGERVTGRTTDLSFLNLDFTKWHVFNIKTVDKHAEISIDGNKVFADSYTNSIKGICNISLVLFDEKPGKGFIDYVWLKDRDGAFVLNHDFEGK